MKSKGPFTLTLTSVVVSEKRSPFSLFLLLPTAPHSNIGHRHVRGFMQYLSVVLLVQEKRAKLELYSLTTTLASARVNRPYEIIGLMQSVDHNNKPCCLLQCHHIHPR